MEDPEKILGISFVSNDQPTVVLQPGKQPFNFPPTAIPSQASQILSFVFPVTAVWRDQFDAKRVEFCLELVGVVGIVTDEVLRSFWNHHSDQGGEGQFDFMWSSTLDVYGNGQTVAVCNGHDFRTLAALCFANLGAPFLAGAKLPSIKASRTSKTPLALRSNARASRTLFITPDRTHC